jgi:hypothetical protein
MSITKLSDITINDVKAYYGILPADTTYDLKLTALLPMVCDNVKNYCRHDFESKARSNEKPMVFAEQYQIYAKYRPIDRTVVPVVTENGLTLTLNTDYAINYDIGKFERLGAAQNIFSQRVYGAWSTTPDGIILSYTGGEALTSDVLMAVYEMCGIYAYMKTKTYVNNQGVEAAVTLTSIPADLMLLLDRHKWYRI